MHGQGWLRRSGNGKRVGYSDMRHRVPAHTVQRVCLFFSFFPASHDSIGIAMAVVEPLDWHGKEVPNEPDNPSQAVPVPEDANRAHHRIASTKQNPTRVVTK